MKILLLQSPITLKKEDSRVFGFFPPLGLAYLAGMLLRDNHDVSIRDFLVEGAGFIQETDNSHVRIGLPETEIIQYLKNTNPDIVGISNNYTSFSNDSIGLAEIIRFILPDTVIVMGGAHASAEAETILSKRNIDAIVRGEGEYIFSELVRKIQTGDFDGARRITGTIWRGKDGCIDNGYDEPITDLDALPFPAYHLLPMEKYINQKQANFGVAMRYPVGHMITSRGCPYNCIFCSTTKHFKKFRKRGEQNIVDEMMLLIRDFNIREFHFHDDSFSADPAHVRAFCSLIIENKLDIRWQVSQGMNASRIDDELLELMHKSGMYRIGFPLESGSEDTLRFIRKPVRLGHVKTLIEKCNILGIYCFGCFMIGFPEETQGHLQETIDFIDQSTLDYVKVSITQPLAGSELYDYYRNLNLLGEGKRSSTYYHTAYNTVYFTADRLNEIRKEIIQSFYWKKYKSMFSPSYLRKCILPKLRSWEHIRYFFKVATIALRELYVK